MARMVKCRATGICGKSDEYINYLKSKDITYQNILELLIEDKNTIISSSAKDKIIEVIISDHKAV